MAAIKSTASVAAAKPLDRDQLGQEIAQQIMAGLVRKTSGLTMSQRILQAASNRIADAGDGIAELSAGFTAAADNFSIARESAIVRQKRRTSEKLAALVELELQARGL